jgi:hypothetical protein
MCLLKTGKSAKYHWPINAYTHAMMPIGYAKFVNLDIFLYKVDKNVFLQQLNIAFHFQITIMKYAVNVKMVIN